MTDDLTRLREWVEKHEYRWADKDESYWLQRLMQEVGELASVLADDHEHTRKHELMQIASICVNWMKRIDRVEKHTNQIDRLIKEGRNEG